MACRTCTPGAFPSGPRTRDDHLAGRFGDLWIKTVRILLDGEDVTNQTNEVVPGPGGLVVVFTSDPPMRCACWGGVALEVRRGRVELVGEVPPFNTACEICGMPMREPGYGGRRRLPAVCDADREAWRRRWGTVAAWWAEQAEGVL